MSGTPTESEKENQENGHESRENDRVTRDDVIVQTPNGERYKAHLINATGLPREVVKEMDQNLCGSTDE